MRSALIRWSTLAWASAPCIRLECRPASSNVRGWLCRRRAQHASAAKTQSERGGQRDTINSKHAISHKQSSKKPEPAVAGRATAAYGAARPTSRHAIDAPPQEQTSWHPSEGSLTAAKTNGRPRHLRQVFKTGPAEPAAVAAQARVLRARRGHRDLLGRQRFGRRAARPRASTGRDAPEK